MKKIKQKRSKLVQSIIFLILYLTWIISVGVISAIGENKDEHIVYTSIVGTVFALVYAIVYHFPLIPFFSKKVNARVKTQIVDIRENYAVKALYTIILGFFAMSICLVADLNDPALNPVTEGWGLLEFFAGVTMSLYCVFSIDFIIKSRSIYYMDKLQHINDDII